MPARLTAAKAAHRAYVVCGTGFDESLRPGAATIHRKCLVRRGSARWNGL